MGLQFGPASSTAAQFQFSLVSQRPFAEVLPLLRQAIEAAGMKVLHEIDPQAALGSIGQAIGGARLLFFFHPKLLAQVLQLDESAIAEVPLKLAVLERDGAVSIRMVDPAAAFQRYNNPALTRFGQEMSASCQAIAGACA